MDTHGVTLSTVPVWCCDKMWAWKVCLALAVGMAVWAPGVRPVGPHSTPCIGPPCEERDTPTLPRIQDRVELKVLIQDPAGERLDMAMLSMDKGVTPGNRSLLWGKSASHAPSAPQPLPVVTVTSRLMYDDDPRGVSEDRNNDREQGRNVDTDRNREQGWSPLSDDLQPRELKYDPVPNGDPYRTDITHAEPTLLAWAGAFVSLLQPNHFPLELVREALDQRISGEELITEFLRAEPGFIICMGVGLSLAMFVPLAGLLLCCCRLGGRCGSSKVQHSHTSCFNFQRRMLTTSLIAISCFIMLGVAVVVVSNERLSSAVGASQRSIHNIVRDLDTFLANTKMQLRYLVTNSFEQTSKAIHNDLDDIEYLLGRPLQRELAAEAQLEVALDSLLDISSSELHQSFGVFSSLYQ